MLSKIYSPHFLKNVENDMSTSLIEIYSVRKKDKFLSRIQYIIDRSINCYYMYSNMCVY